MPRERKTRTINCFVIDYDQGHGLDDEVNELINEGMKLVYNGKNLPAFQSAFIPTDTNFIVISSEPLAETLAYKAWVKKWKKIKEDEKKGNKFDEEINPTELIIELRVPKKLVISSLFPREGI